MTFLPIVEREARAAARHSFLYGWRVVPIVLAIWLLLPQLIGRSMAGNLKDTGYQCFSHLAWLMQFLALLAAWPACNGIVAERREGTLGLLFLTDLKGIDVVLGKTTTFALAGFMVLTSMVPILTITLLMGGVTGGEVARSAVAIISTLLFSISIGLWSASRFANPLAVWKNIFIWMGVLTVLPLCLNIHAFRLVPFILASPFGTFMAAADSRFLSDKSGYWLSLGFVQFETWVLFYLAHRAIGKTWRDEARDECGRALKIKANAAIGDKEPITWLADRLPWQKRIIWTGVVLALMRPAIHFMLKWGVFNFFIGSPVLTLLTGLSQFVSLLLLAWAVCRFLVESRRTGALELLAVTPIGSMQLIQLHWKALQDQLRAPIIFMISMETLNYARMFFGAQGTSLNLQMAFVVLYITTLRILGLYALCWVGMWMAFKARTLFSAVAQTVCLAALLPLLIQTTFSLVLGPWIRSAHLDGILSYASFLMTILVSVALILWARWNLMRMRPGEAVQNPLRIFTRANRQWLDDKINALRRWQAE